MYLHTSNSAETKYIKMLKYLESFISDFSKSNYLCIMQVIYVWGRYEGGRISYKSTVNNRTNTKYAEVDLPESFASAA